MFGKGKSDDPLTLLQQGKYKEAIRLLEFRLQRTPNDFGMKMRLAEALEGAGRKDEAAEIYRAEAESSIQDGQRSQGAALLRKAVKLLPADENLVTRLAQVERGGEAAKEDAFSFDIDMGDEAAPTPVPTPEDSGAYVLPAEEIALQGETGEGLVEMGAAEAGQPAGAAEDGDQGFQMLEALPAPGDAPAPEADAGEGPRPAPEEEPELEVEEELVAKTQPGVFDAGEMAGDGAPAPGAVASEAEAPAEAPRTGRQEDFLALVQALFPELSREEAELLESVAMPRWLDAGEVIIREEEEGDSLFIIARGRLEARGRFESGEFNLALLGGGDLIGEVGFLKRVPRTATVTASEPSLVLELPGEQTRQQLALHPTLLDNLETILQERVDRTLDLLRQHTKGQHGDPHD